MYTVYVYFECLLSSMFRAKTMHENI